MIYYTYRNSTDKYEELNRHKICPLQVPGCLTSRISSNRQCIVSQQPYWTAHGECWEKMPGWKLILKTSGFHIWGPDVYKSTSSEASFPNIYRVPFNIYLLANIIYIKLYIISQATHFNICKHCNKNKSISMSIFSFRYRSRYRY